LPRRDPFCPHVSAALGVLGKTMGEHDQILLALSEANSAEIRWVTHYSAVEDELLRLWNPKHPIIFFQGPLHPVWSFGLAPVFRKSLQDLDRKLQGRVLEAIMKICESPMTVQGDTIKPLSGSLSGLWRCRIGDYRLVYRPDSDSKQVLLLEFASRGSVYD
jgi:mRNA interferase RelE/StbE